MATLDNETVSVRDVVFDMLQGAGVVQQLLSEGKFTVSFGVDNTRVYTYSSLGVPVGRTQRTLYWHDPVIVAPPKNIGTWVFIKKVCDLLRSEVIATNLDN